ncbi:MAG: type II secretion system F family protein [Nanoarchaeota archaeon]|nr:type II secretion system F family protein [Nanoarchaeota archaeon]
MTLKNLIHNVDEEKEIIKELRILISQRDIRVGREKDLLIKSIASLKELLIIINNSIPSLVNNTSPVKSLGEAKEVKELVKVKYNKEGIVRDITINEKDRKKFFEELSLSDATLKRLRKEDKTSKIIAKAFKKPSQYAKISNRFFSRLSNDLIDKGYFKNTGNDLRKANIPFILNTYVSMILFSTLLASLFSILLFVFLLFFTLTLDFPIIIFAEFSASRILTNMLICIAIPVLTFFGAYVYPHLEAGSIGRKINQELPFVTMHMSAIAGSGIEPTQIFRIIALGKEYPYTKSEIKKVINQVNIYGYDLVSALKNSAKSTSSTKLAELFNGLATTISTGGSLTEFLDKRTETLLFDYKLEREKSTKMAETFMDIYISVVIAAPMIMMLLLILISVGPISIGLGVSALTTIIISIVALINIIFLAVLHLKQPVY